jgi:hypothetical protein
VLIHEVIDDQVLRRLVPDDELLKAIVGIHTTRNRPDRSSIASGPSWPYSLTCLHRST